MRLLGAAAALAAGCGANNELGAQSPLSNDGGTDGPCTAAAASSLCPATWELANDNVCMMRPDSIDYADNGTYFERLEARAGAEVLCIYDRASHALVGARRQSDAPDFCSGSSRFVQSGVATEELWNVFVSGRIAPACPSYGDCNEDLSQAPCPLTWDVAVHAVACGLLFQGTQLGHAGGFLAAALTASLSPFACYYDPLTKELKGAYSAGDVASGCDHTSFDVLYGTASTAYAFTADLPTPTCDVDGGGDAPSPP
jgi:hypothetical protein